VDRFIARVGGVRLGSRVVRGDDWAYGEQDAGRSTGTVMELRRWGLAEDVVALRVRWDGDGSVNTYRWAVNGSHPRDVRVVGEVTLDDHIDELYESTDAAARQAVEAARATPATRALLRALYLGLGGAQWGTLDGWGGLVDTNSGSGQPAGHRGRAVFDDPCLDFWDGVVCVNGTLFALDLSAAHLRGNLAATLAALPDAARRALHSLTSLNLAANHLTGPVPGTALCASAPALRFLDLSDNAMTGGIPPCFATHPSLSVLALHTNRLTGAIPPGFGSRSPPLAMLSLHGNSGLTLPLPRDLRSPAARTGMYVRRTVSATPTHNPHTQTHTHTCAELCHPTCTARACAT